MKKTVKRLICVLLCVLLLSSITAAFPAQAATQTFKLGADITGVLDTETGVLTVSGDGIIDDFCTDNIGGGALENVASLIKSVIIEEGIDGIGYGSFGICYNLTSVTFPDSLRSIMDNAFIYDEKLLEINLGSGLEYLGRTPFFGTAWYNAQPDGYVYLGNILYTYKGDTKPTEISIREGTVGIAGDAFLSNTGITSLTIPEGVKTIGALAFINCTNLATISFPDSLIYTGYQAFASTAWSKSQSYGMVYTGRVASDESNMTNGATATVRAGTITLSQGFCMGRLNYYVSLPDSLRYIGRESFMYSYLKSAVIPDGVLFIGRDAFKKCDSLTSVTIPASVTFIGQYAFTECPLLTIHGEANSYARRYADANNIPFIDDGCTHTASSGWEVDIAPTFTTTGLKSQPCTVCGCKMNVTEVTYLGDVTCDGTVNLADVLAMRKYMADYDKTLVGEVIAADIDANGRINFIDMMRLRTYCAEK